MLEKLRRYKRYSAQARDKFLEEWKSSGLSRKRYCEKHNLNINTFDSWVRKSNRKESRGFVPVEIDGVEAADRASYFLIKSDKFSLKIPLSIEGDLLCKIIREIAKCI